VSAQPTTRTCAHGCLTARKHGTACLGDECPGCLPRPAEYGHLCYGCHSRLRNLLQNAHGQWALLLATAGKSGEQVLTAETIAKTHQQPRTTSDGRFPAPFAKPTVGASESEPVRIAALAAAQELADWLSEIVEHVVDVHQLRGPRQVRTGEADTRRKSWHSVHADGNRASRYDPLVTRHDGHGGLEQGQYIWIDPPKQFAVDTAADFLLAWLDRVEALETVADDLDVLAEVMSRAHALAPWREQVARLRGIPCPECHRPTLVRFGGDEDVTCLRGDCRATIGPARYAIWTRMLAEQEGA
jgi:hypothetical protein